MSLGRTASASQGAHDREALTNHPASFAVGKCLPRHLSRQPRQRARKNLAATHEASSFGSFGRSATAFARRSRIRSVRVTPPDPGAPLARNLLHPLVKGTQSRREEGAGRLLQAHQSAGRDQALSLCGHGKVIRGSTFVDKSLDRDISVAGTTNVPASVLGGSAREGLFTQKEAEHARRSDQSADAARSSGSDRGQRPGNPTSAFGSCCARSTESDGRNGRSAPGGVIRPAEMPRLYARNWNFRAPSRDLRAPRSFCSMSAAAWR